MNMNHTIEDDRKNTQNNYTQEEKLVGKGNEHYKYFSVNFLKVKQPQFYWI